MESLYLVRHGQTAWNLDGRAQGHTDIPLDELGIEQAEQVGQAFEELEVQVVFTSDLQRARRTAEQIACSTGAALRTLSELRERSFGSLEGRPYGDVRHEIARLAPSHGHDGLAVPVGGGETFYDVWERVKIAVTELQATPGNKVVVTHGGTCGILLAQLIRAGHASARSFRFGNTAITHLERRSDGLYTLLRYNDTSHLLAPSAPMIDAANPLPSQPI